MRVAIASGKGGTGKTTFATNLAVTAAVAGLDVRLLDCDVEEPDCHLFLWPGLQREEPVTVPVPQVDEELCNLAAGARRCASSGPSPSCPRPSSSSPSCVTPAAPARFCVRSTPSPKWGGASVSSSAGAPATSRSRRARSTSAKRARCR